MPLARRHRHEHGQAVRHASTEDQVIDAASHLPRARKIASAVGRTDYVRVAVEAGKAVPIATSGASILSSTVRAAGCVVVHREHEGMPEGAEVEVLLYDEDPS